MIAFDRLRVSTVLGQRRTVLNRTYVFIATLAVSMQLFAADPSSSGDSQVLRHAVFFKFKDSANEQHVASVVDAFCELPQKIDSIKAFEWGTNNSSEGLSDEFSHCFILTFDDEEGRSAYLPHNDHKAFGNTLRPHLENVFVIDYWGSPNDSPGEKQLRHAVFLKFKDDANRSAVKQVEDAFAALPEKIDSIKAFEWGINNSPERHDHGFTHCFLVTFDSEEGREKYLPHDDHKAFVEILKPVLDKVRVLDFWVQK